ncbi:holin family protein [Paenibacillus sp. GCM10012307]|uniref:Phage holin family protein n=1 Tax=Paenibacillus roseus TaxID=2798579 RepID=A0A934IY30_9BACL|nr:phage holin family protein [Paenibacillus roseus]MBJ6359804.1 phage holin family protein [Paenibacillus roseus]
MHPFALSSLCAFIGAILTFSFGNWPEALTLLLVAMGVDYVAGIAACLKDGQGLCSKSLFWVLGRKGLTLLVILLAHRIDVLLESENMTMGAAIYFYLANEILSIVEHSGKIGLPIPKRIKDFIEVLRDKETKN